MSKHILKLTLILIPVLSYASNEEDMMQKVRALVNEEGIDYYVERVVEGSQTEFPKKMNSLDTVTGMYYIKSTKAIIYNHVLSSDWKRKVVKKTGISAANVEKYVSEQMQNHAIARACSFALNKLYFEHEVKLVSLYADNSGAIIFKTTVNRKDCGE